MSDSSQQTPEEHIAGAIGDLSASTRDLVRQEIASARQELLDNVKRSAPVLGLVGAAAALGLLAAASSYRLSLRVLERLLSPSGAAFLATVGYGAAAAAAARAAWARRDELTVLLPTDTAREAAERLHQVASSSAEAAR